MSSSDNSLLVGMFTSIGRSDGDIVLGYLKEGLLEEIILQDRELENTKCVCLNEADVPQKLKSELNRWKCTGKRGYFTFNSGKVTYYNLGFEPLDGKRKIGASINGLKRGKKDLLEIITPEDLKPKLTLESINNRVDIARGEGVSEGFANGIAVFSTSSAKKYLQEGYTDLILIKERPTPEDVGLIRQLRGIVITQGDVTAHPVILARGYGVPCVTGVDEAILEGSSIRINNSVIKEGESMIMDGSTGNIYLGSIENTGDNTSKYELSRLLKKHETKKIKLNIDSVGSIDSLVELEPSGIGLVRTEHLLFEDQELLNHARNLLLGINLNIDSAQYVQAKYSDLFSVIYRAFDDVRVRLLDIPSDELIPTELNSIETFGRDSVEVSRKAENFRETNPFIGANRACRLAIKDFTLYRAQMEAVRFAAKQYSREPKLIIPYIASPEEVKYLRSIIIRDMDPDVQIGTMIETPSSMLRIEEISKISDFLSFGTNDLFSLMVGLSRSDSKGIRNLYKERNVSMLTYDLILDWVNEAAGKAKAANPKIEIGICGEVNYTDGQIQRLTNIDYLSVSSDRFVYARVQSARNH